MDYAFQREESTRDGIRRIAREQLERAVGELSGEHGPSDEGIHDVRKRMKKLRGLLRLVEGGLRREDFERENGCYRDAAQRLASARRAVVSIAAFDALLERERDKVPENAIADLRARLIEQRDHAASELHAESHAAEVAQALRDAMTRTEDWTLEHEHWHALGPGLHDVYRRARRAYRDARRVTNTETLHEWRKWAKYHFYHVRLLKRLWPALQKPLSEALEELTEALGSEHDLDDLRQSLIEKPVPPELAPGMTALLELVERRREELRAAAFALGARAFAERPTDAEHRVRAYYDAWLNEAPLAAHHEDAGTDG